MKKSSHSAQQTKKNPNLRERVFFKLLQLEEEPKFSMQLDKDFASSENQAGYANRIYTVIRFLHQLDFWIGEVLTGSRKKIHPHLKAALRLGLAELFFMKVKPHAAVYEINELLKKSKTPFLSKVANGCLMNFIRNQEKLEQAWEKSEQSRLQNFPETMFRRWENFYGKAETARMCKAMNAIPSISYLVLKENPEEVFEEIRIAGFDPAISSQNSKRFQLKNSAGFFQSKPFQEGKVMVQDASSQEFCRDISSKISGKFLDYCAAPGGKTLNLLANHAGRITESIAADYSERLERLKENFKRTGLSSKIYDLSKTEVEEKNFDWILVDAPCSATGAIGKYPEIRHTFSAESLPALQEKQLAILRKVWPLLAKDAYLVYGTCSLEKEENDDVIQKFLTEQTEAFFLRWESVFANAHSDSDGFFRILPDDRHMGFFGAIIRKN